MKFKKILLAVLFSGCTGVVVFAQTQQTQSADQKKSDEARSHALADAQKAIDQAGTSDWASRAQRLLYMVQQGIATYGNGG